MEFDRISSFWIGERLGDFERLCVASWIAQGYQARVYAYAPVANLPEGAILADAGEILPRARLFDDAPPVRHAIRADVFCLALQRAGAGVWCDTDVLLLRRLPAARSILIGRERFNRICNAVLWLPPDCDLPDLVIDAFARGSTPPWSIPKLRWRRFTNALRFRRNSFDDYPLHHWGRHAIAWHIRRAGLQSEILPQEAFFHPVAYSSRPFTDPDCAALMDDPRVHAVHCFGRTRLALGDAQPGSLVARAFETYRAHY